jgi:hypothetical protein
LLLFRGDFGRAGPEDGDRDLVTEAKGDEDEANAAKPDFWNRADDVEGAGDAALGLEIWDVEGDALPKEEKDAVALEGLNGDGDPKVGVALGLLLLPKTGTPLTDANGELEDA